MESAFWMSRRYDIPILLIVLNNGGWNAPKVSTLLVHNEGYAANNHRRGTGRSQPFIIQRLLILSIQQT